MKLPPQPNYERDLKELERIYKEALRKVVVQLTSVSPEDMLRRELYESQIRQLSFLLEELNVNAREWIERVLTEAFIESQATAMVSLGTATTLIEAKGKVQFTQLSRVRIQAMIDDTFEDLLQAHSKMDSNLKKLVREQVGEVMKLNTAVQRGTVTSAKEIREALRKQGFSKSLVEDNWQGIIDAGGRRWDLTTYSKMVARTKLQQVQVEGARVQALQNDTDLAIISSHGARDSCRHFEGMIISLEGRTKGYPTYQQLRDSQLIFHPNCQHSVHPIGDLDALPERLKEKARKAEKTAEYALKNRDKVLREDNKRRYEERKERQKKIKEQRKKQIEKARKALKEKRETV